MRRPAFGTPPPEVACHQIFGVVKTELNDVPRDGPHLSARNLWVWVPRILSVLVRRRVRIRASSRHWLVSWVIAAVVRPASVPGTPNVGPEVHAGQAGAGIAAAAPP